MSCLTNYVAFLKGAKPPRARRGPQRMSGYWQGPQHGHWRFCDPPKGAPHKACGRVPSLANWLDIGCEPGLASDLERHGDLSGTVNCSVIVTQDTIGADGKSKAPFVFDNWRKRICLMAAGAFALTPQALIVAKARALRRRGIYSRARARYRYLTGSARSMP